MDNQTKASLVAASYEVVNYDLFYSAHTAMSKESLGQLRSLLEAECRIPSTVLVIGCGTGTDVLSLHDPKWNASYYAFDLVPEMAATAKMRFDEAGLTAEVWVGDILHPTFNHPVGGLDGKIDLAVFRGNCLGHLRPSEYSQAFANVYRSLAPSGRFLFDYRDGHRYFTDWPVVEQLGGGYLESSGEYFTSCYFREASKNFNLPYVLNGVTTLMDQGGMVRSSLQKASGYYVLPERIDAACRAVGFVGLEEWTCRLVQSLDCLRTFIVMKY